MTDSDDHEIELREVPNEAISVASAIREIVIDETARDAVDVHVATDTRVEKGGVLVGDVDVESGRVVVVAAIPAESAISAAASLTFTHEAWDEVNAILSRDYPEHRMVGWYHSHPHFGIFLSEYDTFIQSNFFSAPWQLAYVVDPLLGQSGVFGWEDGNIVRYGSWTVLAHGSAKAVTEPERGAQNTDGQHESVRARRTGALTVAIAIGLVALLVGIVGGYLARGGDVAAAPASGAEDLVVAGQPQVPVGSDVTIQRSWARAGDLVEMTVVVENAGRGALFGYVTGCAYPAMRAEDGDPGVAALGSSPPSSARRDSRGRRTSTTKTPPSNPVPSSAPGGNGPRGARAQDCSFGRRGIAPGRARTFHFAAAFPAAQVDDGSIEHLMQGTPTPAFVAQLPPPTPPAPRTSGAGSPSGAHDTPTTSGSAQ